MWPCWGTPLPQQPLALHDVGQPLCQPAFAAVDGVGCLVVSVSVLCMAKRAGARQLPTVNLNAGYAINASYNTRAVALGLDEQLTGNCGSGAFAVDQSSAADLG